MDIYIYAYTDYVTYVILYYKFVYMAIFHATLIHLDPDQSQEDYIKTDSPEASSSDGK